MEDDFADKEKSTEATYTIYTATTSLADYNAKTVGEDSDITLKAGHYHIWTKGDSYATDSAILRSLFTWSRQTWTETQIRTNLYGYTESENIDLFLKGTVYGFTIVQDSGNAYLIFRFSDTTTGSGTNSGAQTDASVGTDNFIYVEGTTIQTAVADSQLFADGRVLSIADFYMCDHEVTQKEFQTVMGISQSSVIAALDGTTIGLGDNLPAYYINWYAAIAYCNKLSVRNNLDPVYSVAGITDWNNLSFSAIPTTSNAAWNNATFDPTKNGYRLPTEAEWEYAARGGKTGIAKAQYTFSGSDTIGEVAWYDENSSGAVHAVKQKKANALALYDMTGNVAEWCWDWYGTVSTATATGNATGTYRLLRGGSWHEASLNSRLITRGYRDPDRYGSRNGLRVVRNATAGSASDTTGGSGSGSGSGTIGGGVSTGGSSTSGTGSSGTGGSGTSGGTGSVTVVSGTQHGTATTGKTTDIAAGETVTLTITPDDGYTLDTLSVIDGTGATVQTTEVIAGTEYTFKMPETPVSVTTTFRKRTKVTGKIGKYGKPYVVGDIVFSDGSATLYTRDLTLTSDQKSAAIAIIFYVGTECSNDSTSRTLGVGLAHNRSGLAWCTSGANAYSKNITTIQCTPSGSSMGKLTFTGDKDGSDNLAQINAFLTAADGVDDDTATEANYPAFYFAKNYASQTGSHVSGTDYASDWYLPTMAELFQIWKNKTIVDAASELCGGQKFDTKIYRSSSQYASNDHYAYHFYFDDVDLHLYSTGNKFLSGYYDLVRSKGLTTYYVCAVREF